MIYNLLNSIADNNLKKIGSNFVPLQDQFSIK